MTTEDIILSKLESLDSNVSSINEKVSETNIAIAGILPRIHNLESREASLRQKEKNRDDYMRCMIDSIDNKIKEAVQSGFNPLNTKLADLQTDLCEAKKKMEDFRDIKDKFEKWEEQKDKERLNERIIRAIIAALSATTVYIGVKFPTIVKGINSILPS